MTVLYTNRCMCIYIYICREREGSPKTRFNFHIAFAILAVIWGFPTIRGTFVEVPIIRTIVFWGLYWGPLVLGNYSTI